MSSHTTHIAALALAVAALAAGGCGDDDDEPAASGTDASSKQTTRDFPVQVDFPVTPGVEYRTMRFKPQLTLNVPTGAWRTDWPEDSDNASMALVADETFFLAGVGVHRIQKVADPQRGAATAADAVERPEDFIQWLADHPHLDSTEPRAVKVAGRDGMQVDVTPTSFPKRQPAACKEEPPQMPCLVLYFIGAEPFWYYASGRSRFTGIEVGGEQLVIEETVAPKERFDAMVAENLDPAVASFAFSD